MQVSRRSAFARMLLGSVASALFMRGDDAFAETITYEYDALGRIKRVTYNNGQTIDYTYDAAGNRTVLVQNGGPAPSGTLSANPASIFLGNSSTLTWTSANATAASITGIGPVTPVAGGSIQVTPYSTTLYALTLSGPGGSPVTPPQATVTVSPQPPNGTFSSNPGTISPGGSSTLSWTSTDTTSAVIDHGVGAVTPVAGGSVQVSPTVNTTYTLTLTGPSGQTTRQATVNVAPTSSLTATPSTIAPGAPAILTWSSTNATSASIDNGVGAVSPAAGGQITVSPASTTTYTLTVNGPGGQSTSQVTVTVSGSVFTQTIQITGTGAVNLRDLANTAGYNGAQPASIIYQLASNVSLTGAAGAPGAICIDTGTWPHTSYTTDITLQISGKAYGGGGNGGGGGGAGGAGGDAIHCRLPLVIVVNAGGEVKGGGGGGGGGGRTRINQGGEVFNYGGGGGGGGAPNGAGGAGGGFGQGLGATGSPGTSSGGGAGGLGGGGGIGGKGGNGGDFGLAGSKGDDGSHQVGGQGGSAGYAIRKNGHNVTVYNNGTIVGLQA